MNAEENQAFTVLVNQEGQYSLWSIKKSVPPGWTQCGVTGTKAQCLEYVDKTWTDMRPKSMRDGGQRSTEACA
jgi:MbtH protein